jgi:D-alanyl-lipoteichoic acid acyltransferase DltB (MBOAT superfamily)
MSFTSWVFAPFLLVVYGAYRVLPHGARNLLLLVASYVFYGWWDVRFLFLLVVSSALYYASGLMVHRGSLTRAQRLVVSLWVVVSAFAFVVVPWSGLDWNLSSLPTARNPLGAASLGWQVFAGACALVVLANLLHGRVSSLAPDTRRRLSLWAGIAGNLTILAFFKYSNFFIENAEALLSGIGLGRSGFRFDVALPVGISFYTFQGMTYTIDIYRKRLVPTERLLDVALLLAFFPLVLAGPIERAGRLLPQLTAARELRREHAGRALCLILQGLFKKAALADGMARTAEAVFGAASPVSWIDVVAGTFFFAIQLYCDFSGYSDMAVGVASLFGIDVMSNFRQPYFARNVADFWARWHISLSSWFRDYVFFPLGGPSGGARRWMRNVLLTFLVTGLWHGAAWNFVLWGLYHGALLCFHRLKESIRKSRRPVNNAFATATSILAFFLVTCYGWILFRCSSLRQVYEFTSTLLFDVGNLHLTAPLPAWSSAVGLPLLLVVEVVGFRSGGKRLDEVLPLPVWTAAYAVMIFALALGAGAVSAQFVYFTF